MTFVAQYMPLLVSKGASRRREREKSLPIEIVTNQRDALYAPPKRKSAIVYDSVLTRALPLVTLTPSCFARAMMSMRFRAETEWEILVLVSIQRAVDKSW